MSKNRKATRTRKRPSRKGRKERKSRPEGARGPGRPRSLDPRVPTSIPLSSSEKARLVAAAGAVDKGFGTWGRETLLAFEKDPGLMRVLPLTDVELAHCEELATVEGLTFRAWAVRTLLNHVRS